MTLSVCFLERIHLFFNEFPPLVDLSSDQYQGEKLKQKFRVVGKKNVTNVRNATEKMPFKKTGIFKSTPMPLQPVYTFHALSLLC
jgi:hypothetical protein